MDNFIKEQDKILTRWERFTIVVYAAFCLTAMISNLILEGKGVNYEPKACPQDQEKFKIIREYLGYISIFVSIHVVDAIFKFFICGMLFDCIYKYYHGLHKLGDNANLAKEIIWLVFISAIF